MVRTQSIQVESVAPPVIIAAHLTHLPEETGIQSDGFTWEGDQAALRPIPTTTRYWLPNAKLSIKLKGPRPIGSGYWY